MSKTVILAEFDRAAVTPAQYAYEKNKILSLPVEKAVPYVYDRGLNNPLFAADHTLPWAAELLENDVKYNNFDEVTETVSKMLGAMAHAHPPLTEPVLRIYQDILAHQDLPPAMRHNLNENAQWVAFGYLERNNLTITPDPDLIFATPT